MRTPEISAAWGRSAPGWRRGRTARWRRPFAALWTGCLLLALGACARTVPEIRVERPAVPAQLLDCPDAPPVPGADATQRTVGLWILDLSAAHAECRDKLGRVRGLVGATGE